MLSQNGAYFKSITVTILTNKLQNIAIYVKVAIFLTIEFILMILNL